uniref:Bacteriophage protein n=1 Tax=Arsenophonus endosymbiont of Trialeurodes vaporariorum TaxID=235567 RepID=A0A3B0M0Q6_9GAMM
MRYRRETEKGDYSFSQGDNTFLTNSANAVALAIKTRLSPWQGQWFLDREEGTPWLQSLLSKPYREAYGMTLKQRILDTQGVTMLSDFTVSQNPTTRKLTISAKVQTQYGETSFTREA